MPLADTSIRAIKPPAKPQKVADGGGLYLFVTPKGTKAWRLAYRYNGKQKSLSLGVYPVVTLGEARNRRERAKKLLADGIDPSAQRKLDKIAAKAGENTFRVVAEELLEKHRLEGRAQPTLAKNRWLLEVAFDPFGARPVGDVTAVELLAALRRFEERGRYESARRLRSTCGMVFRFAIATGRASRDISVDLRGALISPKVKHRAAIIEPSHIAALLRAIDGYDGHPQTKAALQIAPHVFVRPSELRYAEWWEFNFESATWMIPARRMKMKREHRVPLSRQVIETLVYLRRLTGAGRLVFPSTRSVIRPLSENTLNAALRRLGYGPDQLTVHGFRTTASTRLNEMGLWNPDAIERQLAHQEEDDIRRAYLHAAEFWDERVSMMQAWSDYLDKLREHGKVVHLVNLVGGSRPRIVE
jgi:integrase